MNKGKKRKSDVGFVYLMTNPAFPDYVKIGRSTRDPELRRIELSRSTGVPRSFRLECKILVKEHVRVEGILHQKFRKFRVNKDREFFEISLKEGIKALKKAEKRFRVKDIEEGLKKDPKSSKFFPLGNSSIKHEMIYKLPISKDPSIDEVNFLVNQGVLTEITEKFYNEAHRFQEWTGILFDPSLSSFYSKNPTFRFIHGKYYEVNEVTDEKNL
ncbi:MAG: GIY-YIG nuclease family protein [Candidatus Hodarchaeota archaeon]